jgi:hypothetical protein
MEPEICSDNGIAIKDIKGLIKTVHPKIIDRFFRFHHLSKSMFLKISKINFIKRIVTNSLKLSKNLMTLALPT